MTGPKLILQYAVESFKLKRSLGLHPSFTEVMNESLYVHDPEQYPSLRDDAVQNLHEPSQSRLLTPDEQAVLNSLAEAYNQFVALLVLHPLEQREFMSAIHQAQQIVMSRPVRREPPK